MAILSVYEVGIANENGQARASSLSREGGRTYTRHFIVETDGQGVGPKAAREAIPVAIGQTYASGSESDTASFAQSIAVTELADGHQWLGTVEYGRYNSEIQALNPLDARPKISWTWEQAQRVARKDKDGEPVVNSAGDYFVPGIEADDSRPIFQIVQNESTLFPERIEQYNHSLNESPWFGMAARKWKVAIGPATQAFNPEVPGNYYWEVTYQFYLSREEDGWLVPVADEGMRELYEPGKKRRILDSHGEKIDEPWPLNEDGTKKAAGEELEYIKFNIYKETDFSGLGFDAFLATLTGGA
jgi:hypothetical protein